MRFAGTAEHIAYVSAAKFAEGRGAMTSPVSELLALVQNSSLKHL